MSMLPVRSLAVVGPAVLILACASSPTSGPGKEHQGDQPAETSPDTTNNAEAEQAQPAASATPFSYSAYPDEARIDRGSLGAAPGGTLIAASTDAQVSVQSTWDNGPSLVVFYRGHW